MKVADGDACIIRKIKERELREISGTQLLAMEHIRDQHFEEVVMRHHTGFMRALAREEREALPCALFQIYEIFLIGETIIVSVIRKVHLINDTNHVGVVNVLANDFFRISPLGEKRGIYERHF